MSAGHRPRKRFGQHFLHDPGVIERIVRAIAPRPGQHLVEIGPGLGALTLPLLQAAGAMDVVELDRDVVPLLEERCHGAGSLRVHAADALRFHFCDLAPDGQWLRVVGNLPYNISTPLVFHLLGQIRCIEDMHFMLQKEVVERMAASPGGRDYGRLSVMVQYHCRVTPLFDIGKGAFRPAPKVESSIVRLRPHPAPPVHLDDPGLLGKMVARAFAQRRKTLRNALKGLLGAEAIESAGVDPNARAETLGLEQFAALSNQLSAALRGTHSEEP
ncbi:MAG: 16S rRNA (adenine(1518)-N(6)/adenine(1519)-N(6))-dimethyltransferase RsmA [Gammaproteobacteria bacterium]